MENEQYLQSRQEQRYAERLAHEQEPTSHPDERGAGRDGRSAPTRSGVAPVEAPHGRYPEIVKNQYDVVLADPPWSYYGDPNKMGAAGKEYELMSDGDILNFPLEEWLSPRGIAFIWATCPRMDLAIDLIRSRGLHYRGVSFVWIKTKIDGTPIGAQGVRPSIVKPLVEFVLAASRVKTGRPLPVQSESVVQTVFAPRRKHSQKPVEVHERIEALYPNLSKIELFAREARSGWDSWGDEAPLSHESK